MHDVGASMRRIGPFGFLIAGQVCFTLISQFYKITYRYIQISNCYITSIALRTGVEDEQKTQKA